MIDYIEDYDSKLIYKGFAIKVKTKTESFDLICIVYFHKNNFAQFYMFRRGDYGRSLTLNKLGFHAGLAWFSFMANLWLNHGLVWFLSFF